MRKTLSILIFSRLKRRFPAPSARPTVDRIVLARIYAMNCKAPRISARENVAILNVQTANTLHTVQFFDCGQRWKCG